MLLPGQIASIIGLLLAFGVPQPTVLTVQGILNAQLSTSTPTTTVQLPANTSTSMPAAPVGIGGGAPSNPPPICSLQAGVINGGPTDLAYVIWNTSNATDGEIYLQHNGQPHEKMSPIGFGRSGNPQGSGWVIGKNPDNIATFEADVIGPGGTASCTTSVVPN